ncbi:monocarboxylate transporter 6-like [Arapaima gigas]
MSMADRVGGALDSYMEEVDDLQDPTPAPDQSRRHAQFEAPDGGWGWVVLGATVLVLALTLAFPSCLGIFYTDLQTAFHSSNSKTSWVPSIMTAVLHAGGPFCSVLVEHYGCRVTVMLGGVLSGLGMVASSFTNTIGELYITAGIITGLGFCFSFQPAVTILGHYFVRQRAFVNAVSSTGTAIGLSTLPFLSHFLRSHLGWRGSFLVLGGLLLNCCVCGAVMRPVEGLQCSGPGRGKAKKEESNSQLHRSKLRPRVMVALRSLMASMRRHMAFDVFSGNLRFRIYSVGITWMMLGFVVPLVYLVPYATAHGMDKSRAALLLTILGFVNIFVRPPAGLLFGRPWFHGRHVYVFSAALLVNGLSNSICCVAASFPVLLTYVVVYGLSMSVVGSLLFTVLMSVVEMSRFPAALGLLSIMESITLLLGPPLAGILVDSTGQYTQVFYVCSATVASSAIFLMVSFCWLDTMEMRFSAAVRVPTHKPTIILSDCQDSVVVQKVEVPPPTTETVYVTVA